jgi:choline/glycine/proline betaine transport protein
MVRELDHVLLGLVDQLDAVRRPVHRAHLARAHGAGVHSRRAHRPDGHHVRVSIMGGAAISAARAGPAIIEVAKNEPALSLYAMIDFLQSGSYATLVAGAATLLVAIFFVTSADSGTLVVTTMQCGGHTEPPVLERIQWGVGIGAVAAALLVAGGLGALQAMTIAAALPFAVVLIALGVGFMAALHEDATQQLKARRARKSQRPLEGGQT